MSAAASTPVPTVPTIKTTVGTVQAIDNKDRPDHTDCPDHFSPTEGQKQKSLGRLVDRLRRMQGATSTSKSRRVLIPLSDPLDLPLHVAPEVGTVGMVGTTNENKRLEFDCRSGQRSGQSGQPPFVPDAALTVPPRSENSSVGLAEAPPPASSDDYLAMTVADWEAIAAIGATAEQTTAAAQAARRHADEPASVDPWAVGVAKLRWMPAPDGFGAEAWTYVRRGCTALLASHGNELRRLGWSAEDAFGIHPTAPAAAVHCYGLGVLLRGSRVVNMTAAGATIELSDGVRHSFTRRPKPEAVPVWDLLDRSQP